MWRSGCRRRRRILRSLLCDMVPSKIFPVKPGFGVITKVAAILTGGKYYPTESTRNLAC